MVLQAKMKHKKNAGMSMQIPFGPFLALGYMGIVFFFPFWQKIIQIYFS